jgi:hypothetical protein
MPNPNYGTTGLLSTTIEKWMKQFQEQIFSTKVLLWILTQENKIQNADGGLSIVEPLVYDEAANVGSYADYDVFATDPNTGLSAAEFPWRQFYGLIHISGIELAMNKGEAAILKLLEARLKQLEMTMGETINKQLWSDGAGNGGKDFDGVAAIISNVNPSWGNLGGIDRTTDAYWRSVVKDHGAAGATGLVANMRNVYNTASEGNDHPTHLVGTQDNFELYEDQLVDQARYTNMDMADGGFQNLLFKGRPFTYDDFAAFGYTDAGVATAQDPIWFLNCEYLTMRKLAETWFKPSEMLQPTNQDAFYKNILCYGNLTTNYPGRQAVLFNVT